MRLLIDCHVFDHAHEGSRTYIYHLYKELIKKNKDIDFYFAAYKEVELAELLIEHNTHFVKLKNTSKYYRLIFDFPKIIKKYNIDIAHFQYITPLFKNCKEIVTTHDILFKDFPQYFPVKYRLINDFFFKRSAKRSDLLLTVSSYSRSAISRHYNIAKEKIKITPNAVFVNSETRKVNKDNLDQNNIEKYVLYVSRVEPRKNHITLIKSFFESKDIYEKFKLVLVGRKDMSVKELNHYLNSLPKDKLQRLVWLENISDKELHNLYSNCELFVYPSIAEGFGIPPLEAALRKVPVLCSNTTAMSDYSFFGDNLFNPKNIEELNQKMNKILFNKIDQEKIECIFKEVKTKYSWEKSAEILNNLIKENLK